MGAQYTGDVRIIARGTLNGFVRNRVERRLQRIMQDHLNSWYALVSRAAWKNPAELNKQFRPASIISAERVVFNIKGNEFRLVVAVDYGHGIVLIVWLGTHHEYDQIDVTQVKSTGSAMRIHPVRTERDYDAATTRITELMGSEPGSAAGDELDVLATLVELYEGRHFFPISTPDPMTILKFQMEQQGLTRRDLEPMIGSRARVSEVLNGKRALTLPMIRRIHAGLGIPVDLLVGPIQTSNRTTTRRRKSPAATVRAGRQVAAKLNRH
jgi:antitoxin component HigA of HigAB toxin-antitoxin module/mRNA-degrading endonuclease HigB of HigAB toxin-antitoxin module